jgi:hypothetical protein
VPVAAVDHSPSPSSPQRLDSCWSSQRSTARSGSSRRTSIHTCHQPRQHNCRARHRHSIKASTATQTQAAAVSQCQPAPQASCCRHSSSSQQQPGVNATAAAAAVAEVSSSQQQAAAAGRVSAAGQLQCRKRRSRTRNAATCVDRHVLTPRSRTLRLAFARAMQQYRRIHSTVVHAPPAALFSRKLRRRRLWLLMCGDLHRNRRKHNSAARVRPA